MGLAAYDFAQESLAAPNEASLVEPFVLRAVEDLEETPEPRFRPDPAVVLQAEALAQANPKAATAHTRYAQALLNADAFDEARMAAKRGLELSAESGDMSAAIAAVRVLLALGDHSTAEKLLDQIKLPDVASFVRAELAVAAGNFELALARLGERQDAQSLLLRGWIHVHVGDYRSAIHQLKSATRLVGPTPETLTNLGYAYAAIGARKKAISVTRQARQLAPRSRLIAFNLMSFHLANREFDKALDALRAISIELPNDLDVVAALSHVRYEMGDHDGALKELKRARDRGGQLQAEEIDRAELQGNIAFLEWKTGRRARSNAVETIRKELLRCGYRSLGLARLLAGFFTKVSETGQLETLINGLKDEYSDEELLEFEAHRLYMCGRFEEALQVADRWLDRDPFSSAAACLVTYLHSDVLQDYEGTVRIGNAALQRSPRCTQLANNVAYALAMLGRTQEAKETLIIDESPYPLATKALISIVEGDVTGGREGYEDSAKLAEEQEDPILAERIRAKLALTLAQFRNEPPGPIELSAEAHDEPGVLLFERIVERLRSK